MKYEEIPVPGFSPDTRSDAYALTDKAYWETKERFIDWLYEQAEAAYGHADCIDKEIIEEEWARYIENGVAKHPIAKDAESLNRAGVTQLRRIAKIMHIKNYSKLKKDELILAIIAKKEEMWKQQEMKLWTNQN